jgi:hypothetical protein
MCVGLCNLVRLFGAAGVEAPIRELDMVSHPWNEILAS